jgi:hypothetical protein
MRRATMRRAASICPRTGLEGVRSDIPAEEALAFLSGELLADFPLTDGASCAHALAYLLLPFVRPLIEGPTPLHLFDAPARGTGKGLLIDLGAVLATGRPAEMMPLSAGEELEKRLTALLLSAAPLVVFDEVNELRDGVLATALTAPVWRGRILGVSQMASAPNRTVWAAAGNNVTVTGDMPRRVVTIRLDSGWERPEERTGWRHALPGWAYEERAALVSALLSLVSEWIDAGMPPGQRTLGRFEEWARVVGGILETAGVEGFLGDRDRLQTDADHEAGEWAAMCELWWERHQGLPVSAGDLIAAARERGLLLAVWGGRSALGGLQRLGHELGKRRNRRFGNYVIRAAGRDRASGSIAYRLECVRAKALPSEDGVGAGIPGIPTNPDKPPQTPPVFRNGAPRAGVSSPERETSAANAQTPAREDETLTRTGVPSSLEAGLAGVCGGFGVPTPAEGGRFLHACPPPVATTPGDPFEEGEL